MNKISLLLTLLISPLLIAECSAQTVRYQCSKCGRYHVRSTSTTAGVPASTAQVQTRAKVSVQPASAVSSKSSPSSAVQPASAARTLPQTKSTTTKRWRFHNANKWTRRIDPRAQAWAQEEANRIAQRGYQGYLRNGHPGGNNPYGSVTGTGTTFPGADLIHTCEGDNGMTLVAEAAAVSWDGRIYGVRSWR